MNASRSARAPGVPTVLLRAVRSSAAWACSLELVELEIEPADVLLLDGHLVLGHVGRGRRGYVIGDGLLLLDPTTLVAPIELASIVVNRDFDALAHDLFGFTLTPGQRQALTAVTARRDTLAVLPTGSGKSAIYQLAGLELGGLTIVVSPLIALQRDQLRSLADRGRSISVGLLNSSQHVGERRQTLSEARGRRPRLPAARAGTTGQ